MESCIFCLRNSLQGMIFSQNSRKQELRMIVSLYNKILTNTQQIEMSSSILSEILQLCLSVIESNDIAIVLSSFFYQ